jgi:ABC-type multidrug transport system permease subunit
MKIIDSSPKAQFFLSAIIPLFREPGILFWAFGFPILITLVFSVTFSKGATDERILLGIVASEKFDQKWIEQIRSDKLIKVIDVPQLNSDAIELFDKNSDSISTSDLSPQLYDVFVTQKADALLTPDALISTKDSASIERQLLANHALSQGFRLHYIPIPARGMRYTDWFIPGMIGLTILTNSLFGIGMRIVNDRQQGFFKRLRLSPFRRSDYIIGFASGRALIVFFEILVLLSIFHFIFDFHVRGHVLEFFVFCLIGVLCISLLGTALTVRAKSPESASGMNNLAFYPMMFLSGVYFKTEGFPAYLQQVVQFLPLTAINEGLRGIANEALGLANLLPQIGILTVWTVVCLVVIYKYFDWGTEI